MGSESLKPIEKQCHSQDTSEEESGCEPVEMTSQSELLLLESQVLVVLFMWEELHMKEESFLGRWTPSTIVAILPGVVRSTAKRNMISWLHLVIVTSPGWMPAMVIFQLVLFREATMRTMILCTLEEPGMRTALLLVKSTLNMGAAAFPMVERK